MKEKLAIGLLIFGITMVQAQENIGIGTLQPHTSAILDVNATDKGILFPRVALSKETILSGGTNAVGVVVFNTGTAGITKKGFYFWNGSKWELLALDSEMMIEIETINQKLEQIKNPILVVGNPPVFANEIIDNKQVYIGRFDIEVGKPQSTILEYNTTIKTPLVIANLNKVIDAKIYDATGALVVQSIANITTSDGLSFHFGNPNMYTALPVGRYQLVLKYSTTLPAPTN